ncbi:hypothetical protein Tco_0026350 [Tanacetum coccineum]
MEHMCTTPHTIPIREGHDQYSDVFVVTRVAVNAVNEECLFARESSVAADQHMTPLITNDIPVRTLHDIHVYTTECLKLGSGSSSNKQNISEGFGNVGYAIAEGFIGSKSSRAYHDQYSNVSVVTHVAVNAVDEECLFARDCCSVAAVQHTDPLITNDIPVRTLHDTHLVYGYDGINEFLIADATSVNGRVDGCAENLRNHHRERRQTTHAPPAEYMYMGQFGHFMENIRAYNQMFSMTSFGAKIDDTINKGKRVFPLLFVYGEEGYDADMKLIDVVGIASGKDKRLTMNIFNAY